MLTDMGKHFKVEMRDMREQGQYFYTIEATALGGAIGTSTSYMEVNDERPGPILEPDQTLVSEAGIELEVTEIGDSDAPITNSVLGDGTEYVSAIQVCKASQRSTAIVGVQFTTTNVETG